MINLCLTTDISFLCFHNSNFIHTAPNFLTAHVTDYNNNWEVTLFNLVLFRSSQIFLRKKASTEIKKKMVKGNDVPYLDAIIIVNFPKSM